MAKQYIGIWIQLDSLGKWATDDNGLTVYWPLEEIAIARANLRDCKPRPYAPVLMLIGDNGEPLPLPLKSEGEAKPAPL